ncbi:MULTISPECIES: Na+/H+ antiporter [Bacillus]|uniref:Na+/H+ antiporter n=1 Tax=Bacillus TaxID=1386 RepID=UPI001B1F0BBA|nr:Na+/H+ antiporter [Bacillus sonorensis]GIN64858.1 sodium, potassium, lithium and rubidium/H(+) antiporter [Bacillus sonorensis]
MAIFLAVLVLLTIIAMSNIIHRLIPFVPVPLIQVGLGIIAGAFPGGLHIALSPELFFVLFIAPLLFNDGRRIPRDELWKLRTPILLLALGLVFVTVLLGGYAIHWMIPQIPLPASFALAAILSPTDVVAVSALSKRIDMPTKMMRLLEGEGLMNDASGLVAFKFAIAAAVTGAFSWSAAVFSFLLIAFGGLITGAALSFLILRFRYLLRRFGMEDVTMHMLIQILTPFVVYLTAEELGVSGILAVVAGGITHAAEHDRAESAMVKLKIVSASTWSIILFILNGLVFVLLGLQMPGALSVIFGNAAFNNARVVSYIILITLLLLILRFVWVFLFWQGNWGLQTKQVSGREKLRSLLQMSISGVRGAVTLAGAFSIPFVLEDGRPFPERDFIIFLAAGVILCTLMTASVFLPLLSERKELPSSGSQFQSVRRKLMKTTIKALKEEMNDKNRAAALAVISEYNEKIKRLRFEQYSLKQHLRLKKQENKIRAHALKAEQVELEAMRKSKQITERIADNLKERLQEKEMLFANPFKAGVSVIKLKHLIDSGKKEETGRQRDESADMLKKARIQTAKAAIETVKQHMNDDNKEAAQSVIAFYQRLILRLQHGTAGRRENVRYEKQKKEIRLKSVQIIRNEIQELFENREISRETAHQLRQYINDLEAELLDE